MSDATKRERRPCPQCGFVALRTISYCSGELRPVLVCPACKLENQATWYEKLARRHRNRAADMRLKRLASRKRS